MDEDACFIPSDASFGEQQNKMFVGGLAQTITSDFLKAYFSNFGTVQDAFVLMDEQSGRSRGFGFVTFDSPQTLKLVLKQKPHILGNKQVDCKHAVNKNIKRQTPNSKAALLPSNSLPVGPCGNPMQQNMQMSTSVPGSVAAWPFFETGKLMPTNDPADEVSCDIPKDDASPLAEWSDNESSDLFLTGGGKSYLALSGDKWLEDCEEADARKIFVGGLPDITPHEFAKYFEHFGCVADAMIMYDRKRRRQRGFGFITFASDDGVRNALNFNRHPVKGKVVEVKKAHPLVLQKARAPAKLEAEIARAGGVAAMGGANILDMMMVNTDPFCLSKGGGGSRGNEYLGDMQQQYYSQPNLIPHLHHQQQHHHAAAAAIHHQQEHHHVDYCTNGGDLIPGGLSGLSKYPEAPWHH